MTWFPDTASPGKTLRTAVDHRSFDVWNEVPLIPQLTGMSCWAAAAAMVVSWRDRIAVNPRDVAAGIGCWRAYREGLYPKDILTLVDHWGLHVEPERSWDTTSFTELLKEKGPVWLGEASPGLHSIVVTGIFGDGAEESSFVRINDPWPVGRGERYILSFGQLMRNFQSATQAVGFHAQLLHSGGRESGRYRHAQKERHTSVVMSPTQKGTSNTAMTEIFRYRERDDVRWGGHLQSGEAVISSAGFAVDPLKAHGGDQRNVYLIWNRIPESAEAIDVVLHLHGYSDQSPDEEMLVRKAALGGLDFSRRTRPTLGVVPRGQRISRARLRYEHSLGRSPHPDRYTFPGLVQDGGLGLEVLLAHILEWFGRNYLGRAPNQGIPVDRLLFTSHLGGAVALNKLLRFGRGRRVCDPNEIHILGALLKAENHRDGIADWAVRHVSSDRASGGDGAMCVLAAKGGETGALALAGRLSETFRSRQIQGSTRDRYRIIPTTTQPASIGRLFSPMLLDDFAFDSNHQNPLTTEGMRFFAGRDALRPLERPVLGTRLDDR